MECSEKVLVAASMIFGGLTFLLPSALTTYMYLTKWIPEEPDPEKRKQMAAVLASSAIAGSGIIVAGVRYLKKSKCL